MAVGFVVIAVSVVLPLVFLATVAVVVVELCQVPSADQHRSRVRRPSIRTPTSAPVVESRPVESTVNVVVS